MASGSRCGDLGGDGRVVRGVGREVDGLQVDVDQLGHLLDLGGDELQGGRVGEDEQEGVGARGLGRGDAGHPDGDARDRGVRVRVGELEGGGAVEEDARAGPTRWRRRRSCRPWSGAPAIRRPAACATAGEVGVDVGGVVAERDLDGPAERALPVHRGDGGVGADAVALAAAGDRAAERGDRREPERLAGAVGGVVGRRRRPRSAAGPSPAAPPATAAPSPISPSPHAAAAAASSAASRRAADAASRADRLEVGGLDLVDPVAQLGGGAVELDDAHAGARAPGRRRRGPCGRAARRAGRPSRRRPRPGRPAAAGRRRAGRGRATARRRAAAGTSGPGSGRGRASAAGRRRAGRPGGRGAPPARGTARRRGRGRSG